MCDRACLPCGSGHVGNPDHRENASYWADCLHVLRWPKRNRYQTEKRPPAWNLKSLFFVANSRPLFHAPVICRSSGMRAFAFLACSALASSSAFFLAASSSITCFTAARMHRLQPGQQRLLVWTSSLRRRLRSRSVQTCWGRVQEDERWQCSVQRRGWLVAPTRIHRNLPTRKSAMTRCHRLFIGAYLLLKFS